MQQKNKHVKTCGNFTIQGSGKVLCLIAKNFYVFWLLWVCCIFSGQVFGAVLEKLYEVKIPVESQSQAHRQAAIKVGFGELLIRITGDSQFASSGKAQKILRKSENFVHQFRYERIPLRTPKIVDGMENEPAEESASESNPAPAPLTPDSPQLVLAIVFEENMVNEALWKNNLPVWGKTRPSTLVWVAVQDLGQRFLLNANEPSDILDALTYYADKRGMPLIFPLTDLTDQNSISVSDVWGNFSDPILAASQRYQPDAVFVGRVFRDPFGGWQARWALYQGEQLDTWEIWGQDIKDVVRNGIDRSTDGLANRYAQMASSEGNQKIVDLLIDDVKSLQDYVKTSDYLVSLAPVAELQVRGINATHIVYRVLLRGQLHGLKQAIALGTLLAVVENDVKENESNMLEDQTLLPSEPASFRYRLLP